MEPFTCPVSCLRNFFSTNWRGALPTRNPGTSARGTSSSNCLSKYFSMSERGTVTVTCRSHALVSSSHPFVHAPADAATSPEEGQLPLLPRVVRACSPADAPTHTGSDGPMIVVYVGIASAVVFLIMVMHTSFYQIDHLYVGRSFLHALLCPVPWLP